MPNKWDKPVKKLERDGLCVTKNSIANTLDPKVMHYHTMNPPTEASRRWYLDNGWSLSDWGCHASDKPIVNGDPHNAFVVDC